MFKPIFYYRQITDITPDDLLSLGIKAIMLDVDNTLAHHGEPEPFGGVLDWLSVMKEAGFKLVIISNNGKKRVGPFARALGLDCASSAAKPLPLGFWLAARRVGVKIRECAVIGDQIFSDVMGANLAGAKPILVQPRGTDPSRGIRFKRRLERPILKKLRFKS